PWGTARPRLANLAPTPLMEGFKRPCTDRQKVSSAMNNGEPALAWNDEDRRIKLHDAPGLVGMRRAGLAAADVLDFITHSAVREQKLLDATYEAMMLGIAAVRRAARLTGSGAAIQGYAEAQRFSVVRDFCGHGIGRIFHDAPSVLHFGTPGHGPALREGMFF